MKIDLIVEKGVHCGLEFVKNEAGTYYIGRSPKSDLALIDDEYTSRAHCQIEVSTDGAILQHGQGQSGTFLNGKPVRKALLADADAIVIGRSLVRVHLEGIPSSADIIKPSSTSIEGFELVKPISSDGPGETYWAASNLSNNMITLHMLHMDVQEEGAVQRFLQESEICARLKHPGLLTYWKQGIKGHTLWFATDLIEGNTLEQYITSHGPLDVGNAVALMQQVMDVVVYLHEHEVIHRALRPASLRVKKHGNSLEAQLTDLGSAKCFHTEELQRVTHTGECGFPIHPYTAPEALIDFRLMDPRIDIYALGGLLYFMLTGHPPYQPSQDQDLVLTILETAPTPIVVFKPNLSKNIVQIVERAMARELGARYSSVQAMRQALIPDVDIDYSRSLDPQNQQPIMNNYEVGVFVSYAWGGESERTVDEVEKAFSESGINIVRDKKDLGYKGSIEAFEQRIAQGQCIILVISDKYLRSEHCMYELVEAEKYKNLYKRIFPIVLADALIYKAIDRLAYIKYWEEQIIQLDQSIKQVNVMTNLAGITTTLDKYAHIRTSFDHLTDLLSNMNALTPEKHTATGFAILVDAVECAMNKKKIV